MIPRVFFVMKEGSTVSRTSFCQVFEGPYSECEALVTKQTRRIPRNRYLSLEQLGVKIYFQHIDRRVALQICLLSLVLLLWKARSDIST